MDEIIKMLDSRLKLQSDYFAIKSNHKCLVEVIQNIRKKDPQTLADYNLQPVVSEAEVSYI